MYKFKTLFGTSSLTKSSFCQGKGNSLCLNKNNFSLLGQTLLQEAHDESLQAALNTFNLEAVGGGASRKKYEKELYITVKKQFEVSRVCPIPPPPHTHTHSYIYLRGRLEVCRELVCLPYTPNCARCYGH